MHKKDERRTRKMLRWARRRPELLKMMCMPGCVTPERMQKIIWEIADRGYDELILLLVSAQRQQPFLQHFDWDVWLRELVAGGQDENTEPAVTHILAWLAQPQSPFGKRKPPK